MSGTSAVGIRIQIPVAADLEQILLELRQVARAGQRRGVHQERRLDFGVAVLARVEIEHEVDERAGEPRAGAHQHGEARAGHAGGALEIQDAERGAEFPVRLRFEVERRRLPVLTHDLIVLGALADRHAGVGHVGQAQQQLLALRFDRLQLDASSRLISSARALFASSSAEASSPARFALAICSPA